MSVEQETRLSRWSKLKQARQVRQKEAKKRKRGKAAPLVEGEPIAVSVSEKPVDPTAATGAATIPEGQIAGPFKPWMPPLNVALPSEAEIPPGEKTMPAGKGADDLPKEADYDLPPIETLTPESDFTPFMKDGIPELLKRRAMRKLWMSNPVLANLDGLNEYDEDYSMIGKVIEEVATRYKVGKGLAYEDDELEDIEDVEALDDDDGRRQPEEGATQPIAEKADLPIEGDADDTGTVPTPTDSTKV
ncbi:MAG: DUF3306 domain-containing protein [Magnetovibrionaceae bacterium]